MQIFIASLDPSHNRARLPAPVRAGLLFVMAVLVLASAAAQARVRWVGDSSNCEYHTIDQAISAAGSSSGPDEVRITKDHPFNEWHGQALVINNQEITIGGNWDYCGQPDAEYTVGYGVVSGFGGVAAPVFRITGTSHVDFYGLKISLGDPPVADGLGGGIDFAGKGSLSLRTVILQYNVGFAGAIQIYCANSNGSICPSGQSSPPAITVTLRDNVYFYDNQGEEGGGMNLGHKSKLIMKNAYTFFHRNHAQYGGAIFLGQEATAEIGSPQPAGTDGVFFQNSASVAGGAIYVGNSSDQSATVNLYSISAAEPLSFIENRAYRGAAVAIDLDIDNSVPNTERAVCSTNVYYRGNSSGSERGGSVVDVQGPGASFSVNSDDCLYQVPADGRINCGPLDQSQCDRFVENQAASIFENNFGGNVYLRRVRVDNNATLTVLYALGTPGREAVISIHDSVIDNNEIDFSVASVAINARISVTNVTIAENQMGGGNSVLRSYGAQIFATNSIIDQDSPLFGGDVSDTDFAGLLVRNPGSYPLPVGNVVGRPSYIPGFYRLQPYSEGIDRVIATPDLTDPDGTPRSIDNTTISHIPGYYADIGAYESTATSIPPGADTIFASSFE